MQILAKNICELSLDLGQGNSKLERWYFDNSDQNCKPFTYTGLKGNANNFLSLKLCKDACQGIT